MALGMQVNIEFTASCASLLVLTTLATSVIRSALFIYLSFHKFNFLPCLKVVFAGQTIFSGYTSANPVEIQNMPLATFRTDALNCFFFLISLIIEFIFHYAWRPFLFHFIFLPSFKPP
jgi:hypothetical protein